MSVIDPRARGALVVASLVLAGCHLLFPFNPGDPPTAGDTGPDRALAPDGAVRDGPASLETSGDPSCAKIIGKHCTVGNPSTCSPGHCIQISSSQSGVCSCPCTPDDITTKHDEDDCPGKPANICGTFFSQSKKLTYCFKRCTPNIGVNDCDAPLTCQPTSAYYVTTLAFTPVCGLLGCSDDVLHCPVLTKKKCKALSDCDASQGERCALLTAGATEGRCAHPGRCDLKSGLCDVKPAGLFNASAKVGDTCDGDLDCGAEMTCLMEVDRAATQKPGGAGCSTGSDCCSGICGSGVCTAALCPVYYRNGYCTIKGCAAAGFSRGACTSGSLCNLWYAGGYCQRSCTLSDVASCRGVGADKLGDYECRAWNNATLSHLGWSPVSPSPVCDFGPWLSCATASAWGGSCAMVGVKSTNATNMSCRGLDGQPKTDHASPVGLCLDNTPSGSLR